MNLDQRLADAAHHVAGQVEPPEVDPEAVRSRVHARRRRTTAIALAAAVATAALVGRPLLDGRDSTAPQPASSPTSSLTRTLGDTSCDTGGCLESGTYSVDLGQDVPEQPLQATVTVRGGAWESNKYQRRLSQRSGAGAVVLHVYQPQKLAGPQPCGPDGATNPISPDATVDDVAHSLATLEQLTLEDGPRTIEAFGRDARYLQVRADRITCPVPGTKYHLVDILGGDDLDIDPGQPVQIQFWVVTVAGKVVVVEARREGSPGPAAVRALDQLRDSLTFMAGR